MQNKLPSSKASIGQIETQAEKKHLLLDSLLLRKQTFHPEQNPVLCIHESGIGRIL